MTVEPFRQGAKPTRNVLQLSLRFLARGASGEQVVFVGNDTIIVNFGHPRLRFGHRGHENAISVSITEAILPAAAR
jgi:hypothetical protein